MSFRNGRFYLNPKQTMAALASDEKAKLKTEPVPIDEGIEQKEDGPLESKEEEGGLDDDEPQLITVYSCAGEDEEKAQSFEITKKCSSLSKLIRVMMVGDQEAVSFPVPRVDGATLALVVDYLKHHDGVVPGKIPCPVRSKEMKDIVSDPWDAEWMDAFDNVTIFKVILAANYMEIIPLLHLACAKIATIIKALPQKEINEIIKEEEEFQKAEKAEQDAEKEEKKYAEEEVDDEVKSAE